MNDMMEGLKTCVDCGNELVFAAQADGALLRLDPTPAPDGRVFVVGGLLKFPTALYDDDRSGPRYNHHACHPKGADARTRDRLWKAAQAERDRIQAAEPPGWTSSTGDIAYYTSDGETCLTFLDLAMADGSHTVFRIRVAFGDDAKVATAVNRWTHNNEDLWENRIANPHDSQVVIDGVLYKVGRLGPAIGQHNGFAGRRFDLEFLDGGGRIFTHDLWKIGAIPPVFRTRLPDTAKFVTA